MRSSERAGVDPAPIDSGVVVDPDHLGLRFEASLSRDRRRASGSYFTPRPIAEGLVEFALVDRPRPASVCDPAVGGGAFLLAAARWLEGRGLDRATIVREHLWGVDLDPEALAVADEALWCWSAEVGQPARPGDHLIVGDSLLDDDVRRAAPSGGFDLVVGNPPFLGQLGRATARTRDDAARLRARFGEAVGAYTDTAALFVLAAPDLVAPGGTVALVLPSSFLATRDSAAVRRRALEVARLDGLWTAGEPVFDAHVEVCAPVLVRDEQDPTVAPPPRRVRRASGPTFAECPSAAAPAHPPEDDGRASWSPLAAHGRDEVIVDLPGERTLGELARATAGFRDQYYALSGLVVDDPDDHHTDDRAWPALVTSGLVDPGVCRWGRRPTRFGRQSWARPRIDLARLRSLHPKVGRWADELLVPKLVVATQTRVVEAAVDVEGRWYPSTPTIAVVAPPEQLWRVAAVVLAPAISAWSWARVAGSALTRDAIKVSASDVAAMPLPVHEDAWYEGADRLQTAVAAGRKAAHAPDLRAFAVAMGRAYAVGDDVAEWWAGRLPAGR